MVEGLAARLTEEYGRGFSRQSLFHMLRFSEAFPDPEIVSALSRQLGWSHFLIGLKIGRFQAADKGPRPTVTRNPCWVEGCRSPRLRAKQLSSSPTAGHFRTRG